MQDKVTSFESLPARRPRLSHPPRVARALVLEIETWSVKKREARAPQIFTIGHSHPKIMNARCERPVQSCFTANSVSRKRLSEKRSPCRAFSRFPGRPHEPDQRRLLNLGFGK